MGMMEKLAYRRHSRAARELMLLYGLEIPANVGIGKRLTLQHRGLGTVIHPATRIGDDVTIYHQVTIGRLDAADPESAEFVENDNVLDGGIEIGDHAVLCAGAKILARGGGLTRVGEGTVVAANAVLTESTGDWEIWGGIPARKLGERHVVRSGD